MTGNLFFFAPSEQTATAARRTAVRLVERVTAGDAEAFGELYRAYAPMVHGIVLARVNRDDVDDLVQDVFLSAYRKLSSLRDPAAVGAWLAMIARNCAAEYYRRKRPTEELPEDLCDRETPRTEAREILNAIRSLPDAYRETLVLRLVEGMTGPEIAERTGLKPESVRVNLHRGMKLLREKLGL
ncbi:MAG: sigma-70 family RNA polymerase sigma factor [Acidobacteria bacterium]|nr:sigma-70 family RNA polymerase sigma factor [Acidobacteriota bacterium]